MRKGKKYKTPRHANTIALCNNYITIYNIIPNTIIKLKKKKLILLLVSQGRVRHRIKGFPVFVVVMSKEGRSRGS